MDGVDAGDLDGELRDAVASCRRTLSWAVELVGDTKVRIQTMSMATWKPSRPV
jgi:hypothetical protein